ncbi:MAG: EAL domain-containing protein [Actinoplanes sp.]
MGLRAPRRRGRVEAGVRSGRGRRRPCETAVFRVIGAAGRWRWVEGVLTSCPDAPDVGGIVCNLRDVTARIKAENAIRESEARYRAIADTAQEGIWTLDPVGRTLNANKRLVTILGVTLNEIYSRTALDLLGVSDGAALVHQSGQGPQEYDLAYRHPDGGARVLRVSVSPLRDDTGQTGSLAMLADVTEARRAQQELAHRALRDELTGLANRTLLADRLEQAVARGFRGGRPVAVLFAGLDQFRLVNDSCGHAVGDALLIAVAQRLAAEIRAQDTVARFAGDEFVVVCEDTSESHAVELADRLLAALAEPFDIGGRRIRVQISVGVAVAPQHSGPELLRFAEAAMNDAKAHGGGRVQAFDMALAEDVRERLALSNELHDALSSDHLRMFYQPVVSLADGRIGGLEALARWSHPVWGAISPARFVPVAEMTGLAVPLDRWALDRVCRDSDELRRALLQGLRVAVNVSAAHVGAPGFESAVLDTLSGGRLAPGELTLEITESAMMANLAKAEEVLRRLRALGVEAAIDDFGTGYSSLRYLGRLPAGVVKIDRSFVEGITEDADALAIASSIIQLAHRLRLTTVAEGVETPQQLNLLRRLGCAAAQGYLFSPAVPPEDLITLVRKLPGYRFPVEPGTSPARAG